MKDHIVLNWIYQCAWILVFKLVLDFFFYYLDWLTVLAHREIPIIWKVLYRRQRTIRKVRQTLILQYGVKRKSLCSIFIVVGIWLVLEVKENLLKSIISLCHDVMNCFNDDLVFRLILGSFSHLVYYELVSFLAACLHLEASDQSIAVVAVAHDLQWFS